MRPTILRQPVESSDVQFRQYLTGTANAGVGMVVGRMDNAVVYGHGCSVKSGRSTGDRQQHDGCFFVLLRVHSRKFIPYDKACDEYAVRLLRAEVWFRQND